MLLAVATILACQTVEGDRLVGRDLAAANPAFAGIDAQVDLGPAPLPGLRRVLHSAELIRLATRIGITFSGPAGEACFERAPGAVRSRPARNQLSPPEVKRGDNVLVEVAVGTARLSFQAPAESSGHISEMIVVRNPENGKLFRARVEGPGKVSVKK
jgi:hypothetical protein